MEAPVLRYERPVPFVGRQCIVSGKRVIERRPVGRDREIRLCEIDTVRYVKRGLTRFLGRGKLILSTSDGQVVLNGVTRHLYDTITRALRRPTHPELTVVATLDGN